ncbi:MAG: PIN domain-containing protein [Gemmatimonadota bacterium]
MSARYLVDKSALARMPDASVRARLGQLIQAGQAATCAIIELEILYSARNAKDHRTIRSRRAQAYERVAVDDGVLNRAMDVQGELARRGQHRLPIPDLIVAAAAEAAGLVVLHDDAHFDQIAIATGQSVEWVVPRGTV